MPSASLNTDTWVTAGLGKPGKVLTRASPPTISYFRPIREISQGPLNANEYITSRLGLEIGLPMPKIEFINYEGQLGTISHLVATNAQNWAAFPFPKDYELYLDIPTIVDMIVFDTWVHNEDRHAENLMQVKNIATKKYDVYLIDNTETLYGRTKPSNRDKNSFLPEAVVKIECFKNLLKKDLSFFEPSIGKIESMQDSQIGSIIEEVPADFIGQDESSFINDFLKTRKINIRQSFKQFCESHVQ